MTFSNVLNLVFGVIFGLIVSSMITILIVKSFLRKRNRNENITSVSDAVYDEYFVKNAGKNAIMKSLLKEATGVSSIIYPASSRPLYELSINEIIRGMKHLTFKLKTVRDHPLCNEIKNIHVSSILFAEEKIAKPVLKVTSSKVMKIGMKAVNVIKTVINLINPVFYLKKIINATLMKSGKKGIIIISLDFIGNNIYEVYELSIKKPEEKENER